LLGAFISKENVADPVLKGRTRNLCNQEKQVETKQSPLKCKTKEEDMGELNAYSLYTKIENYRLKLDERLERATQRLKECNSKGKRVKGDRNNEAFRCVYIYIYIYTHTLLLLLHPFKQQIFTTLCLQSPPTLAMSTQV
jgi:hypothetical protein